MATFLKRFSALCALTALLGVALYSCKKDDDKILDPGQVVLFLPTASSASYRIASPTTVFKIPVGLTSPLTGGKTRTVNITATSPTGAVEGTHFTYTKTVSFAPGKITDTIVVTGIYAQYLTGRTDVLEFTFADAADFSPTLNRKFTLNVVGPCYEGNIDFSELVGDYTNTFENGSYGPYTSTITGATEVTATSSTATITNIYDNGIEALATFDYSTPGSFTVTIAPQFTGLGVGGKPLFIRSAPGETSTFSYCNKAFTLHLELYTSSGPYDSWVMTMEK